MEKTKITPDNITKLKKNEVFIFGSNMAGNHAGGAAKYALDNFGAQMGNSLGIQGSSFAIPTLDANFNKLPLEAIKESVALLQSSLQLLPKKHFLLTEIGCGIAGFNVEEIAPLFKQIYELNPSNISWPQLFVDVLGKPVIIHGFKGFDQNLKCRGFQYELGKEYTTDEKVKICNTGFHFCEHPLDVFNYYPPASNRFAMVEGSGETDRENNNTKACCSKIKIGVELNFKSLVEAAIKFTFDRAKWTKNAPAHNDASSGAASATGYGGAASATGDRGAASVTGSSGAASATGYRGAASATGYRGAASATGDSGAASATGDSGAASATGDSGAASATGYSGAASATGDSGAASATGYRGAASATGKHGIAIANGIEGKAKASKGNYIVIAEWEYKDEWSRKDVKCFLVDGEKIKADTYYMLVNGEAKETA